MLLLCLDSISANTSWLFTLANNSFMNKSETLHRRFPNLISISYKEYLCCVVAYNHRSCDSVVISLILLVLAVCVAEPVSTLPSPNCKTLEIALTLEKLGPTCILSLTMDAVRLIKYSDNDNSIQAWT